MSSSRPKPKRPSAIDAAVRSGAGLPDAKRPKFDVRNPNELAPDAPDEEDIFLEVDEGAIGKRKSNRNKVDIEGYESDSSEEGFDATRKTWRKDEKADRMEDNEGDDMFADFKSDGEGEHEEGGAREGRKKSVKFMDLEQIEGQDFASKREFIDIIDEDKGRGESEDDSEDAEEQDIDPEVGEGGRKKGAPKIDAFNMQNEMDEGRFDEAGNFIRKATEKDAVHDSWLEGVSRKDMRRAREAMEKREAEKREKMREDDAVSTSQVLTDLITCLEKGETILEALARLGTTDKKPNNKKSWRQKKKAAANSEDMDVDTSKGPSDPAEARRKEAVERITGAADRLLTRGQLEVYDESRESLIRQYRREVGEDWVEPKALTEEVVNEKQWEFRWTDGRDGGDTHGPYDKSAMASWNQHSFFDQGAEFREVGGSWTFVADFE